MATIKFYKKWGNGGKQGLVKGIMKGWVGLWMAELTLLHIMILVSSEIPLGMAKKLKGIVHPKRCGGISTYSEKCSPPWHCKKFKNLKIFVLFEHRASCNFFLPKIALSHVTDSLCNIFDQNFI